MQIFILDKMNKGKLLLLLEEKNSNILSFWGFYIIISKTRKS